LFLYDADSFGGKGKRKNKRGKGEKRVNELFAGKEERDQATIVSRTSMRGGRGGGEKKEGLELYVAQSGGEGKRGECLRQSLASKTRHERRWHLSSRSLILEKGKGKKKKEALATHLSEGGGREEKIRLGSFLHQH